MKKLHLLVLAAGVVLAACMDQSQPLAPGLEAGDISAGAAGAGQVADPFVQGRVLARFRPGAPAAAVAAANGARVQREVTLGILMLEVPAGAELRVIEALSRNPNVEFAEPDYIRTFGNPSVMPVNDPFSGYKWDLDNDGKIYGSNGAVLTNTGKAGADIDWNRAYDYLDGSVTGSVVIGIMDTGIRHDHEDLVGRIKAEYDFFAGKSNAADDNGHGTHVAGIAGAATDNGKGVAGVSFASTQFAIAKVCGPKGRGPFSSYGCPLSAIAQGITWAVDNGAHVLNISLGGSSGSSSEQAALQYARSNNVLPFCATGNNAGSVSYPAAFPECVAVGATDWGDNLASYSNFGPQVVLSAPGGDTGHPNGYSYILSSYNSSATSYAFMAGTSMASPQAAGLAALLHAIGETDANAKLQRMIDTADDLGPSGWDNRFGYGRINAYRAVSAGGTPPPPPPTPENQAPTASFTFSCTYLECSFDASASTDDVGITSYNWAFGDGQTGSGVTTSHTYGAASSYTVALTVVDVDGETDTQSKLVTVSNPPSGGGLSLSATGYKVRGVQHADLTWSGATSASIDVYRGGAILDTVGNSGAYTDIIGGRGGGSFTYRVCEAGTTTCSDQATVTF